MPRIQQILHAFTCRELCYLLYGYHKVGFLPKPFAKLIEQEIASTLRNIEDVDLEEVQLMTQVFSRTRVGSREFHRLLETCMITRIQELKTNPKVLHSIGFELETSGLCSLDTLKALKKVMLQVEME